MVHGPRDMCAQRVHGLVRDPVNGTVHARDAERRVHECAEPRREEERLEERLHEEIMTRF